MTDSNNPAAIQSLDWRWRLFVLTNAHVVGTLHSVCVWAMAPLIAMEMQLSAAQFGLFVSAYYGAQTCCAFPAGAFADRVGVGRSLVVAMLILTAGALALSMAPGLASALIAMALMGVGYSIVNPATARGVLNWFPFAYRASAMGVKQTGVPLGGVLAAVAGVLATLIDWRIVLWIVAVITVLNVVTIVPLLKIRANIPKKGAIIPLGEIRALISNANVRVFCSSNTLLQIGQGNFFAYLTLFLRDVGQTSQGFASLCLGIAQVTSAAGRVGWGVVCDRFFSHRRTRLVVLLLSVAVIALLAMILIQPNNVRVLAILLSSVLGVTIAAFAGITITIASETVEPERAGTAVGFNLMMVGLGGVVGPPLFGLAMDLGGGFSAGWIVTAVMVTAGIALLRFVFVER